MAVGWKRGAEVLIARSRLPRIAHSSKQPTLAVLAYHNIVPHGETPAGDVSLHVDQRVFSDQLDFILETHEIVPLENVLEPASLHADAPRAVITFDDAYTGAMTAGMEELSKRSLPATVFVAPGLLGASGFWWDLLAPPGGVPLSSGVRAHALGALEGRHDLVADWAKREGLQVQTVPPHARPATEATLVEGASPPGVSLGAHSWTHPNLARILPSAVIDEMDRSRRWLLDHAQRFADWFAYPYGLRNAAVVEAARERFHGALLIGGGLSRVRGSWTAAMASLPRVNVARGVSLEGLELRLAGILSRPQS